MGSPGRFVNVTLLATSAPARAAIQSSLLRKRRNNRVAARLDGQMVVRRATTQLICNRSDRICVAGIYSGGFMAAQMHVAYSALFRSAAIYTGEPDGCALGTVATALNSCSYGISPIDVAGLECCLQSYDAIGTAFIERAGINESRTAIASL